MDYKKDAIYTYWVQYTTKNEEASFRQFICGFVAIWETKLNLKWINTDICLPSTIDPEAGPSLSRLPDELLPAIAKFLYIAKDNTEKNELSEQNIIEAEYLIRCLIVISRNFYNIPLLTSCDYIKESTSVAINFIHKLTSINQQCDETTKSSLLSFCYSLCHFLECLYDPYQIWRCFDSSQMKDLDMSKLQYSPSMLHVEVVPFIFDCFETNLAIKYPLLAAELLNVFGAIVCGSQHNALRGVSPPTCTLIMKVISDKNIPLVVKTTALRCFVTITQVMIQFPPHQCQLDVYTQIECLRDTLKECTAFEINTPLVLSVIKAIGQSIELSGSNAEKIRNFVVECKLLEIILNILNKLEADIEIDDVVLCVETVSLILRMSNEAKKQMLNINGYEKIFEFVGKQSNKSQPLLKAIISIATENTDKTLDQNLENAQMIVPLIEWLPSLDEIDQVWLASVIFNLCTTNLQSKCQSSACKVIDSVCKCLENSNHLYTKTVHQLLKLIENLASHSISTSELKKIFLLIRNKDEPFPYTTQILRTLSEVAYNTYDNSCKVFFDIQKDKEGLTIDELKKWPGPMNGLTFHCWLRLDNVSFHHCSSTFGLASYRRQLLHLLTNSNTGLEIFIGSDWTLVVGMNTKKEFFTVTARDFRFVENRWYCIDVCYSPPKRPFGHNQVSIFIDGVQNISAPAKFTPLIDQFQKCSIGTFLAHVPKSIDIQPQGDRGILPSFITQVPNYLLMRGSGAMDPYVKEFPSGMQDTLYGRPMCLKGQLGLICLFPEHFSIQQIKSIYDLGPNYSSLSTMDDSTCVILGLFNRSVFYFSPTAASSRDTALDLSQKNKINACLTATVHKCSPIQDVINMIGGLYVLFPILESQVLNENEHLGLLSLDYTNTDLSVDLEDMSSIRSFSLDEKLELHPIGLLLILTKNLMKGNIVGQEQLLRKNGIPILGELLTKVPSDKIDLQMLEAMQLFMESLQELSNIQLLRAFYQHILFNFSIWSRCSFNVQIVVVKIIYLLIKNDRKSFRKRFGVQYFLDTIRFYYTTCDVLSVNHITILRASLLDVVRFYILKEVNISDVDIIVRYLITCRSETMIIELLDILIKHLETDSCKDQLYLLMYEPQTADILYCILIEKSISMLAKYKVLKLLSLLLRTKYVYERQKSNLRLQNSNCGLYPGLISLLPDFQNLSMEVTLIMFDQVLLTDSICTYPAILSILHRLAYEDIDIKLEVARKLLAMIYMNPNAAKAFAKQSGWQDCVTRLLVHRLAEGKTSHNKDLMSFEDHDVQKVQTNILKWRSYPNILKTKQSSLKKWSSMFEFEEEFTHNVINESSVTAEKHFTDAASFFENEIKGVAGSVSAVVVDNLQYATENLSSAVNTVGLVVSDNIQIASDNLAIAMNTVSGNIHSATSNLSLAVTSAYSMFKQKTTEIQEIGESAKERIKKYAMYPPQSDRNVIDEDKAQLMTKQLLAELGLDIDTYSISNKSMSSSLEDISSIKSSIAPDNRSISSGIAMSDNVSTVCEDVDSSDHNDFDNINPWQEFTDGKTENKEKDLCSLVENILFVVMWRGVNIHNKNCWKERGQVMACINMLSLNNMLYCSHLELKLHILEKAVEAVLSDLHDAGSTVECDYAKMENIGQLIGLVYDLVVLDPSPNFDKKCSVKLLDECIKLIEQLAIFGDNQEQYNKDIAMKTFGLLLSCSSSPNMEICAMATVKLHTILQTSNNCVVEVECYLLRSANSILQKALKDDNMERYSFILPLVKTLITKLSEPLNISNSELPNLTEVLYSGNFYDRFLPYCTTEEWTDFIETKVSDLCKDYRRSMNAEITESMNTFWAECYESYKNALDTRSRLVAESRKAFQTSILEPYKNKKQEEESRIYLMENQKKAQRLLVRAKWRQIKGYLCGERGPWKSRVSESVSTLLPVTQQQNPVTPQVILLYPPQTEQSSSQQNVPFVNAPNYTTALPPQHEQQYLLQQGQLYGPPSNVQYPSQDKPYSPQPEQQHSSHQEPLQFPPKQDPQNPTQQGPLYASPPDIKYPSQQEPLQFLPQQEPLQFLPQQGQQYQIKQGTQYVPPPDVQYPSQQGLQFPLQQRPQYASPPDVQYPSQQGLQFPLQQGPQYAPPTDVQYPSQDQQYSPQQEQQYSLQQEPLQFPPEQEPQNPTQQGPLYASPPDAQYPSQQEQEYSPQQEPLQFLPQQGQQYQIKQGTQYVLPQDVNNPPQGLQFPLQQGTQYAPPPDAQYPLQQEQEYSPQQEPLQFLPQQGQQYQIKQGTQYVLPQDVNNPPQGLQFPLQQGTQYAPPPDAQYPLQQEQEYSPQQEPLQFLPQQEPHYSPPSDVQYPLQQEQEYSPQQEPLQLLPQQGQQYQIKQGTQYAPPQDVNNPPQQGLQFPPQQGPHYAPPPDLEYPLQQEKVYEYLNHQRPQYELPQNVQNASQQEPHNLTQQGPHNSTQQGTQYEPPQDVQNPLQQGLQFPLQQGPKYAPPPDLEYPLQQEKVYGPQYYQCILFNDYGPPVRSNKQQYTGPTNEYYFDRQNVVYNQQPCKVYFQRSHPYDSQYFYNYHPAPYNFHLQPKLFSNVPPKFILRPENVMA